MKDCVSQLALKENYMYIHPSC